MKGAFFTDSAKTRVRDAIKAAESQTAAEIVVTMRAQADRYLHAYLIGGVVVAFAVLGLLLFLPQEFNETWIPVDVALGFGAGFALVSLFPSLRFVLAGEKSRSLAADRDAKAAFFDLGISKTRGRTGILIYTAPREERVVLVPDVGIPKEKAEKIVTDAKSKLEVAVARGDLEAFAKAIEDLGSALEPFLPRTPDDVNELPDEVA